MSIRRQFTNAAHSMIARYWSGQRAANSAAPSNCSVRTSPSPTMTSIIFACSSSACVRQSDILDCLFPHKLLDRGTVEPGRARSAPTFSASEASLYIDLTASGASGGSSRGGVSGQVCQIILTTGLGPSFFSWMKRIVVLLQKLHFQNMYQDRVIADDQGRRRAIVGRPNKQHHPEHDTHRCPGRNRTCDRAPSFGPGAMRVGVHSLPSNVQQTRRG
jgi:hypothetical protein